MSSDEFYRKNVGRAVRSLFSKAVEKFERSTLPEVPLAIDLGCGIGIEVAALLEDGWSVVAIDQNVGAIEALKSLKSQDISDRLQILQTSFEELSHLPPSDFIFSFHSLPFCKAESFKSLMGLVSQSLKPGAILAATFFGPSDDWVKAGKATGVRSVDLKSFFSSCDVLHLQENEMDAPMTNGAMKHWHILEFIAKKRA